MPASRSAMRHKRACMLGEDINVCFINLIYNELNFFCEILGSFCRKVYIKQECAVFFVVPLDVVNESCPEHARLTMSSELSFK